MIKDQRLPEVIIITGPTGIGKSQLALQLADKLNGEIVSADCRQIYKYLEIGTAKPTIEERSRIPHHLIDIIEPTQRFSAEDYRLEAARVIKEIHQRGRMPLVTGGTGFYLKALVKGLFIGPRADQAIRTKLEKEAQNKGNRYLYDRLCQIDWLTAERLHPNDRVRIVRALEVYELTAQPISVWQQQGQYPEPEFEFNILGLRCDRKRLYERINHRVEQMIAAGLKQEVQELLKRYPTNAPGLKAHGYMEIVDHFIQGVNWQKTVELIKQHIRNYAKRQLTWFRKDPKIKWFEATDSNLLQQVLGYLNAAPKKS